VGLGEVCGPGDVGLYRPDNVNRQHWLGQVDRRVGLLTQLSGTGYADKRICDSMCLSAGQEQIGRICGGGGV
jgi:hypothetical protein